METEEELKSALCSDNSSNTGCGASLLFCRSDLLNVVEVVSEAFVKEDIPVTIFEMVALLTRGGKMEENFNSSGMVLVDTSWDLLRILGIFSLHRSFLFSDFNEFTSIFDFLRAASRFSHFWSNL